MQGRVEPDGASPTNGSEPRGSEHPLRRQDERREERGLDA
jgi:hypothetical protein